MFFPFLLALLFLDAPSQEPSRPAGPTFPEAVQMATDGRDADALAAFRQLAAARPNDHDARLWIARLHERMGHRDLAEPVYHSVFLEDPANLDAALGVASMMLARDVAEQAIEVLEVAEARAPRNAAVLALLGRGHRLAGRTARALVYFERAAAAAPTEEHRLGLEAARRAYFHHIETRGFSEQFSGGTPDSRSGDLIVNYRLTERLRALARGQVQRKFTETEGRGGGGVEWRWKPAIALRGQVLIGPDNLVMPEGDYLGEIEHTRGPVTWTASVRHFDFTGARMTTASPAVAWLASEKVSLGFEYALSWTEVSTSRFVEAGHSAHLRAAYRLWPRVWAQTGYAAGVDDFEDFSIDRIGDFRANAVSGGVRVELPRLTSFIGSYQRQWRSGNVEMGRVTVSLQQRF